MGYRDQVMLDKLLIEDICRGQSRISTEEISKIVQTFKNNKAQDMQGLAAEHLKFNCPQGCPLVPFKLDELHYTKWLHSTANEARCNYSSP